VCCIPGVEEVGAPPGEVALVAHPIGPMRACKWAVPVAIEHPEFLSKAKGGLASVHCVPKVKGGGGHGTMTRRYR
jgi:hypothetical protein